MDKALGYLGLALRAGKLTVGAEDSAKALRGRKGTLLIAASDAGANTLRQAETMAAGKCPILPVGYTKEELAQALGKSNPVALALLSDKGLALAFAAAVKDERGEQEEHL